MLIKFHVDTNFRIVVLRRNSGQWAMPHKSVIMPACGAYGQVLLLTDKTLRDIWEGRVAKLVEIGDGGSSPVDFTGSSSQIK